MIPLTVKATIINSTPVKAGLVDKDTSGHSTGQCWFCGHTNLWVANLGNLSVNGDFIKTELKGL